MIYAWLHCLLVSGTDSLVRNDNGVSTSRMVLAYESRAVLACLTQAEMIRSSQHGH